MKCNRFLYAFSSAYRTEYDLTAQRLLQAKVVTAQAQAARERVITEAAEDERRLAEHERMQREREANRRAFAREKEGA